MKMATVEMSFEDWVKKGEELFGTDKQKWRFVCPACGHIQSGESVHAANPGIEEVSTWIAFSCEGRVNKKVGCNWSLGGLLQIHERTVTKNGESIPAFVFDGEQDQATPSYTPRERPMAKNHPHDK